MGINHHIQIKLSCLCSIQLPFNALCDFLKTIAAVNVFQLRPLYIFRLEYELKQLPLFTGKGNVTLSGRSKVILAIQPLADIINLVSAAVFKQIFKQVVNNASLFRVTLT